MALNQITYVDKVENGGITDDGKVLATNMNEIKTVTNGVIDSLEDTVVKIGSNAGATAQGASSVAVGRDAGQTTQGSSSVAIGQGAGNSLLGNNAVAIGLNAGSTSLGTSSVAIGANALTVDTGTDTSLVAIGLQAGQFAKGGSSIFLGRATGVNSTGKDMLCIGSLAGSNLTTETESICLGRASQVTGSQQLQLGQSSMTTYAYGAVQDRSDERDKAEIQDVHLGLEFIEALTPRSYKLDYREDYKEYKEDEDGNIIPDTRDLGDITHDGTHKRTRLHCGLVAQEVKQVMDDLGVDFAGYQDHSLNGGQDVKSIGYSELISPLIKAVQELSARVKVLEG